MVRELVESAGLVLPFDAAAAEVYGPLRDAVLVTGSIRQLTVENWLTG